ncbi:glycosyltransferase family 2 protein [Candidatus Thioglobus sp.]|nr:glycosyltransferase family 2 protein [Candidatus Thioglobus sp.]
MLQIYILSKDRPNDLKKALNSVINQDGYDFEIIVSDNSESREVVEMMRRDFKDINLIDRTKVLDPAEHIVTVIREATSEYILIFHDDDVLKKNHVSTIMPKIILSNDIVAVCTDSTLIGDGVPNNKKVINSRKELLVNSPNELIEYYFGLSKGGIIAAWFSGYIYRASSLKQVAESFENRCGKHCDVQLLVELLSFGKILWLPSSTFYAQVNSEQASASESIYDRIKLINFMISNGINRKSNGLKFFKCMYLYRWLKIKNKSIFKLPRSYREKIILKFLFTSFLYLIIFSFPFQKKIISRLIGRI